MAAQLGKELLLKIHDGSASFADENYVLIGGFTSNDITITGSQTDITSKDSGGFRESLSGGGQRSISSSAKGVFMSDAAFEIAQGHVLAGTTPMCRIIVPGHGTYEGKFALSSLMMSGGKDDSVSYDLKFDSAGPVTFTAAA